MSPIEDRDARRDLLVDAVRGAGTLSIGRAADQFPEWPGAWLIIAARDAEAAGLIINDYGRLRVAEGLAA